jgi:hypothetical protein
MLRSAVITLLVAPVLALSSVAYAASPTTLLATVQTHGSGIETVSLVEGSHDRGEIEITSCGLTGKAGDPSSNAYVCKGPGTVFDLGPGRVRIRWKCPANKCAKKAEGTLKSHRSLLGLLHVKASVTTFRTRGSQFGIVWEPTGE